MHIDAKKRRVNLPQEVGFSLVARRFVKKKGVESTTRSSGEVNATTNNVGFYPRMSSAKNVPTSVEKGLLTLRRCYDTQPQPCE